MKSLLLASACVAVMPFAALAQDAPAATTATPSTVSPANPTRAERTAARGDEQGEIIVTATRRSQVLSDVPIAVSAVSAEQLKNSGGSDIRQLNQLAPSLLVSSATNDSSAVARIRGIGTVGENPGLESSVAVFIDGVYRSRTGVGLTELGEVERIEVLRGPQGTLFGRNASAGLINIITAKPSFDLGGTAEFSYGNFNNIRFQGGITGPILGDKVAFRVDGVYNKRDGFLPDAVSGRDTQNRDRYLIRGQFLIKPTDDLSVRLIGDFSRKDEECCGAAYLEPLVNYRRNADGSVTQSPNTIAQIIRNLGGVIPEGSNHTPGSFVRQASITPGSGYRQRTQDWGVSGEVNWKLSGLNLTSITAYREYKNDGQQDGDFNSLDILQRDDSFRQFKTFTQELRVQGTAFHDRLDFLVGGYYSHEELSFIDDIKFGADAERYGNCLFSESFGRALGAPSLVNTADSSCFNRAVAGAVITNPLIPAATRGVIRGLAGLGPLSGLGFNPAGGYANLAAAIGFPPLAGGGYFNNTGVVRDSFKQTDNNYAFFTHNVLSIVPDKLLLTVGLRYTHDTKDLDTSFNHNNTFCAALRASPLASLSSLPCAINGTAGPGFSSSAPGASRTESRLSGTAVLSFKPTEKLLTYLSYSRGYKAGGFNLDTAALKPSAPSAYDLQFKPEIVDAYEIGGKLDLRHFKVNAAVFYEQFQDFQLNLFNGVNFQVTNIESCKDSLNGADTDGSSVTGACAKDRTRPGVTSTGFELESYLYPARDVAISAGFTLADTKYRKNLTGVDGSALGAGLFQLPGRTISNSSKYTVTGSAAWTPALTDSLSALAYIDFRYQSDLNTGSDLDFEKMQDGFLLVNARIGLYGRDKVWGIELWSQNLLDKKYQQIAADAPAQGSGTYRQVAAGLLTTANPLYITFPAEPRTFGFTVRTRF